MKNLLKAPTKLQIKELSESAELGDSRAQYQLGEFYSKGHGVKRCKKTAFEWMEKSAQQGHVKSQIQLGSLFVSAGYGVRDYDKAFFWAEKAAEKHDPEGLHQLAFKYEAGQGTQPNFSKAISLYHQAAELGSVQSQMTLGSYFKNGDGVKINQDKSFFWYEKAAFSDQSSHAQFLVGLMCLEGVGTTTDKTRAIDWLRKSAKAGHRDASYFLGFIYFKGDDVQQNIPIAMILLKKAAYKGNAEAMELLGRLYLDNDMLTEAYKNLSKSCSCGNQNSCELLENPAMSNYVEKHLSAMKINYGNLATFLTSNDSRSLKEIELYFDDANAYYKKYEGESPTGVLILALARRKFMATLDHKCEAHLAIRTLDKLSGGALKKHDDFKKIVAAYKSSKLTVGSCLDRNSDPSIFKFISSLGLALIGIDNDSDSYNLLLMEQSRLLEFHELACQADIKILFNN